MAELIDLVKEGIQEFSESKFGIRTDPTGPLNHLKLEVDELLDSIKSGDKKNEEEEWADCFLLLLDSFRIRFGNETSFDELMFYSLDKLKIIKQREYPSKPDENGIYKHIKTIK